MRHVTSGFRNLALAALVLLTSVAPALCQLAADSAAPTVVPQAVVPQMARYSGVVEGRAGGIVEMTFRIYSVREGGEPLWTETQQVSVGQDEEYTVLLGARAEKGLPQAVFAAGQARWLGIAVDGAPEQPRVPLDSVAYAMKAADAETLGGYPPRSS